MKIADRFCTRTNKFPTQNKLQSGNTLIPAVIALSITVIATVGFLREGSKLSDKSKVAHAQYEILEIIDEWNSLKEYIDISAITTNDFPSAKYKTNIYGGINSYSKTLRYGFSDIHRNYLQFPNISDIASCEKLKETIKDSQGISKTPTPDGNTSVCIKQMDDLYNLRFFLE